MPRLGSLGFFKDSVVFNLLKSELNYLSAQPESNTFLFVIKVRVDLVILGRRGSGIVVDDLNFVSFADAWGWSFS